MLFSFLSDRSKSIFQLIVENDRACELQAFVFGFLVSFRLLARLRTCFAASLLAQNHLKKKQLVRLLVSSSRKIITGMKETLFWWFWLCSRNFFASCGALQCFWVNLVCDITANTHTMDQFAIFLAHSYGSKHDERLNILKKSKNKR